MGQPVFPQSETDVLYEADIFFTVVTEVRY